MIGHAQDNTIEPPNMIEMSIRVGKGGNAMDSNLISLAVCIIALLILVPIMIRATRSQGRNRTIKKDLQPGEELYATVDITVGDAMGVLVLTDRRLRVVTYDQSVMEDLPLRRLSAVQTRRVDGGVRITLTAGAARISVLSEDTREAAALVDQAREFMIS